MGISMTILFSIACFIIGYWAGSRDQITDDQPDGSKYLPEELKDDESDDIRQVTEALKDMASISEKHGIPIITACQSKENNETEESDKLPENLQKYYAALEKGNKEKAAKYLKKNAEVCPDRDSNCLNGMFCPECPRTNGGLIVVTDHGQIL